MSPRARLRRTSSSRLIPTSRRATSVVAVAVAAGVPLMMTLVRLALVRLALTSLPPLAILGVLAEMMALLRLAPMPVAGAQVTTTRAITLVEAVGAPLIPSRLLRLLGKRSILLLSILLGRRRYVLLRDGNWLVIGIFAWIYLARCFRRTFRSSEDFRL
jgi:hypothetical protein